MNMPLLARVVGIALCCSATVALGQAPAQDAAAAEARPDVVQPEQAPPLQESSELKEAEASLDKAAKLQAAGRYGDAITQAEQALQRLEATPGSPREEMARCLSVLGGLYWLHGDFPRAEVLLKRALALREATLGTNHPDVARSRNQLAALYQAQGWYGRAEPLHERALAIQEAVLGKNHPEVATTLNHLASLYQAQGLYDRAEPLYQRALAIREAAFGKSHPDVAVSLGNLASLHEARGAYGRAEPLLQRALAIQEATLGKGHPEVAVSLSHLATLYRVQGSYERAEGLYQRALAIQEATLGKNHPDVASSLNELAILYREQGAYARAEPLAQRALAIREAALGEKHPDVAASLAEVARLQLAQQRLSKALPLLTRSFNLSEERLRREALDFSEARLASFLQFLRADEERLYSLARLYPEDARVQRLALTAALLRKGRSADETANTSRAVYRSLGFVDRDTFERLRGLRSQLAALSLAGPGALALPTYQRQIADLRERGDALEAKLAKRSARLRALTALPPSAEMVERVAAALPRDAALVELVAYEDRPPVIRPSASGSEPPGQVRYLALVLFPGARVAAVDLGPAAPIDAAVSRLHDALASRDAAYQALAQALHSLVFKPLVPLLGDVRRIFLAPDGQLSLVPFAALHDGRRALIDVFDFTYLTSGKDLLPRAGEVLPSQSVVVFADPDFSSLPAAPPSSPSSNEPLFAERGYLVQPLSSAARADLTNRRWVPLPGTRQEAEALHRLFPQAQVFQGPHATKDQLLHVAAPGILHIATHGFFLQDPAASAGTRALAAVGSFGGGALPANLPDPLLRSGLVLAGAQAPRAEAGAATSGLDQTLVTALELAGVDLWGTHLVVLSACDTGRGDIKLGQGVYGLRRALVIAGAETVVMSLWKVNDETTRTLMESYYRNLLAGEGRTAALRHAMQALREARPHPHFWAPFISLGRDAPLGSWMRPH